MVDLSSLGAVQMPVATAPACRSSWEAASARARVPHRRGFHLEREGRCPGRHHGQCPFGFFSALPDSIVVEGWWDKYGWVKGFHIYNLSCPGSLVHLCPRMSLRLIQLPSIRVIKLPFHGVYTNDDENGLYILGAREINRTVNWTQQEKRDSCEVTVTAMAQPYGS